MEKIEINREARASFFIGLGAIGYSQWGMLGLGLILTVPMLLSILYVITAKEKGWFDD